MPTYPEIPLAILPGREVARRIREFDPDAIHIATEGPLGLAARALCLKHGLAFTTAYHTCFPEYVKPRFGVPLALDLRVAAPLPRAVVGGAGRHARDPRSCSRRAASRNVADWSRGVDTDLFRPGARALRRVCPARCSSTWGASRWRRTCRPSSGSTCRAPRWWWATGRSARELERRFPDARLRGHEDAARSSRSYYQRADVFVFPSRTDTFGLVLVEAMACGTPVAAYPVRGPIDVVDRPGRGRARPRPRRGGARRARARPRPVRALSASASRGSTARASSSPAWCRRARRRRAWPRRPDGARDPGESRREPASPFKGKTGLVRIWHAFFNSCAGLADAWRHESAFRQEILLAAILIPVALHGAGARRSSARCWSPAVLLVMIVELLNTGVEVAIDRISFEHHSLSKRAKDIGSAAVLTSLCLMSAPG